MVSFTNAIIITKGGLMTKSKQEWEKILERYFNIRGDRTTLDYVGASQKIEELIQEERQRVVEIISTYELQSAEKYFDDNSYEAKWKRLGDKISDLQSKMNK